MTEQDTEKEQTFDDAFEEFSKEEPEAETAEPTAAESNEPETDEPTEQPEPNESADTEEQPKQDEPENEVEKYRKMAAEWEHKYRSDAGRVSALQKQINELKNNQEAKPTDQQLKEALSSDAGWQDFREDFPEAAGVLEHQFSQMEQKITEKFAPIQEQVQSFEQKQDRQRQKELLTLPKEQGGYGHADFQTIRDSQDFQEWCKYQHPSTQELLASTQAADAAYVLDIYKSLKGDNQKQQQKENIFKKRRDRQLRNIDVEGQAATPKSGPPEDFAGAFDYFAAKG